MIQKIDIKNFRSHKNTELEFVKGVNCIIGNPDSGKTNIIRAINWVLFNRPLGFRMHSDFVDDPTNVTIELSDGKVVSFTKSKSRSVYDCNGEELKAIGSDVPDEVKRILQMSELNIQRQLDKPFLICDSSGEVAKIFNRITRLEKPDKAVSLLTTDINSDNKKLKILVDQKNDLENRLEDLSDVEKMEKEMKKLVLEQQSLISMIDEISDLEDDIRTLESYEEFLKSFVSVSELEKVISSLEKVMEEMGELEFAIKEMEMGVELLEGNEKQVDYFKKAMKVKAKKYKDLLSTITVCPFCAECKEPLEKHNLTDVLKGMEL